MINDTPTAVLTEAERVLKDKSVMSIHFGHSVMPDSTYFVTINRKGANSVNTRGHNLAHCLLDALNELRDGAPRPTHVDTPGLPGLETRPLLPGMTR